MLKYTLGVWKRVLTECGLQKSKKFWTQTEKLLTGVVKTDSTYPEEHFEFFCELVPKFISFGTLSEAKISANVVKTAFYVSRGTFAAMVFESFQKYLLFGL